MGDAEAQRTALRSQPGLCQKGARFTGRLQNIKSASSDAGALAMQIKLGCGDTQPTIPSLDRVDLTCIRPAKGIGLTWVELKPCQGHANAMAEKRGAKPLVCLCARRDAF